MKKTFQLTNYYIILGTPLILFALTTNIYLAVISHSTKANLILGLLLSLLMTSAFIGGWFNMIKLAVSEPLRENPNSLITEFVSGVGEFFASSLGGIFNAIILSLGVLAGFIALGTKLIGNPGITLETLNAAMANTETLKAFLISLSPEQLTKINQWNLLLCISVSLSQLFAMLYMPAIFFKSKNPFKAFLINLKDLFSKKFFKTFGIYLLIVVTNLFISILTLYFGGNVVTHFLLTLANFYFMTVVAVGIFYYYYNNFVAPQLGKNIDTKV